MVAKATVNGSGSSNFSVLALRQRPGEIPGRLNDQPRRGAYHSIFQRNDADEPRQNRQSDRQPLDAKALAAKLQKRIRQDRKKSFGC